MAKPIRVDVEVHDRLPIEGHASLLNEAAGLAAGLDREGLHEEGRQMDHPSGHAHLGNDRRRLAIADRSVEVRLAGLPRLRPVEAVADQAGEAALLDVRAGRVGGRLCREQQAVPLGHRLVGDASSILPNCSSGASATPM